MRITIALIFGTLIVSSPADAQEKIRKDIHGDPLPEGALARLGTIKFRPGDVIQNLAFSPDGKQIACWTGRLHAAEANALAIYDIATGNELRWTQAHDGRCHALAWLRDGRGLALVQPDPREKQVLLWEFTDPHRALPISNKPRAAQYPSPNVHALSPDGQWVVEADIERPRKEYSLDVRRWQSGKKFHELEQRQFIPIGDHEARTLFFSSDGNKIISIGRQKGQEHEALVVEVKNSKQRVSMPLPPPIKDVFSSHSFAVSPGEQPFLAFQDINAARIVNLTNLKEETALVFSSKSRYWPGPWRFRRTAGNWHSLSARGQRGFGTSKPKKIFGKPTGDTSAHLHSRMTVDFLRPATLMAEYEYLRRLRARRFRPLSICSRRIGSASPRTESMQ
ncbi:MAG: WD40 repeat domain-containing protein [Planctomycetes bacterium]|nr:WD40 repeat domain-containing protein [Planctomycetota bacterium]